MRHHNSRLRLILAVSTVLALLASPAVVTLGASDEDDPGIASAMRYRATHGFPHSEAHVRHTFANPEAYPDGMFGVPLSDEETAEVMRRIRALGRTEAAFEWANEQDSFGGAYQDQDAEGKVVFQFTDGLAQARDQLDALIPDDVDFAVVRVDFSMKELRATKYRVAESSFAQELGQRFISVGPAVRGNVVEIGIEDPTSADVDAAERAFGSMVKIVSETVPMTDDCGGNPNGILHCPPVKGGIKINNTERYCTSGFLAKRTDGSHDDWVLVTAGHCMRVDGESTTWRHDGNVIGTSAYSNSVWCCPLMADAGADIGYINLDDPPPNAYQYNDLLVESYNPLVNDARGIVADSAPQQAEEADICRMGAGSQAKHSSNANYKAKQCGNILRTDRLNKVSSVGGTVKYVDHVNTVNFDSTGGDSGGLMFVPYSETQDYILGTHIHSEDDDASATGPGWYEPVGQGFFELYDRKGVYLQACTVLAPC